MSDKAKSDLSYASKPTHWLDEHQIHVVEPESLTVGQLNYCVRALREALYQEKLKHEAHQRAAEALRRVVDGWDRGSDGMVMASRLVAARAALAELDKVTRS